jgi:hypothetical protein
MLLSSLSRAEVDSWEIKLPFYLLEVISGDALA